MALEKSDILFGMRTTIDIPDVLYRAVKSRAAEEGTTIRHITVALYGDWMQRPDWHPKVKTEVVFTDDKPERTLSFFGMLKPRKNIEGPQDMETIRKSIVRGRKKEFEELKRSRGFV